MKTEDQPLIFGKYSIIEEFWNTNTLTCTCQFFKDGKQHFSSLQDLAISLAFKNFLVLIYSEIHENNCAITYTYYYNKHYSSYYSGNKTDQTQIHFYTMTARLKIKQTQCKFDSYLHVQMMFTEWLQIL